MQDQPLCHPISNICFGVHSLKDKATIDPVSHKVVPHGKELQPGGFTGWLAKLIPEWLSLYIIGLFTPAPMNLNGCARNMGSLTASVKAI